MAMIGWAVIDLAGLRSLRDGAIMVRRGTLVSRNL
jgi:hypothetical protein